MWADAHAARRCRLRRPASQPLWSCQHYSLNQKATPKRLRSRSRLKGATATRCAAVRLHLRYLRFFKICAVTVSENIIYEQSLFNLDIDFSNAKAAAWSVFFSKCIQKHLQTPTSKHPIHIFCRFFKNSGCEK